MVMITEDSFYYDSKSKGSRRITQKHTCMLETHSQRYGSVIKYLLGMCPIIWWYIVKGLLSSVSYSSIGKQIANISPHADPSVYELVLKTE